MLGLLLGIGGESTCIAMLFGSVLACCAFCSLYQCCQCRLRDCKCLKRALRLFGCDPYDDLDLFIVVHEVLYTAHSKVQTCVRVTAGRYQVSTDLDRRGVFHQPLSLFIEQGTEELLVEMLDAGSRQLAVLRFSIRDIAEGSEDIRQKVFTMQQKDKAAVNPRVRLTIRRDACAEDEGLLSNVKGVASAETQMLLQDHLRQLKTQASTTSVSAAQLEEGQAAGPGAAAAVGETEMKQLSELDIFCRGCAGALQLFGSWGSEEEVYMAILCPPDRKKHTIGLWNSERERESGKMPKQEIDLLKVQSVQPDAGRSDVFLLNYVNAEKIKSRHTFRRVDRSRDVWVELLSMLITKYREEREAQKKAKAAK